MTPALFALIGAAVGMAIALAWARRPASAPPRPQLPPGEAASAGMAALGATVADVSPDALVLYTDVGRILYANPTARDMFFEGQDPRGQNFLRLAAQAPTELSKALLGESDRLFSLEVERQHETFHLSRRSYELEGQDVTLLILRNMTREVSRREVETLKNVVRVISHEVNNSLAPIASLVGSARLIAERPEHSAKLASVFDTIDERARHLQAFLAGYAGLARLPAPRRQEVPWEPFLTHVRELYPAIQLAYPPTAAGWFDPVQIEQVLINLVKNAVEAGSPEDGVALAVTEDSDGSTCIEVCDAGPGFNAEAFGSAFMPFYTTKANGSGMGHTLCREIVHAHGGTISLANREAGGARVTVVLPGATRVDPRLARSRTKLTLSRG